MHPKKDLSAEHAPEEERGISLEQPESLSSALPEEEMDYTAEEAEEVKKRLRALGYL